MNKFDIDSCTTEQVDSNALFTKYQKLISVICCPRCNRELNYPNADRLDGIPIRGEVCSQQCGDVGQIAIAKELDVYISVQEHNSFTTFFSQLAKKNEVLQ